MVSMDDPGVDTDLGTAFTASIVPTAWEPDVPAGESRLRRVEQGVQITSSATVKITPITDGAESSSDIQTFSFSSITDGQNCVANARTSNVGAKHQARIEVTAHVGSCELDGLLFVAMPKRSE